MSREDGTAVRFSGETPWDAIINSFSLDIVEESDFQDYVASRGYGKSAPLETLETLHLDWHAQEGV